MAVYHAQDIASVEGATAPSLLALAGGRLARRSAIPPVIRGQDKIPAVGRRVIATQSLNGEIEWLTPDASPTLGTGTHPVSTTYRVVARARADITPGHFLRLSVLCVPSGQTQVAGDNVPAGIFGTVRVTIVWHNQAGGTVTTTHDSALPASASQHGAAPANPWAGIHLREISLMAPPEILLVPDIATWTRHVGAVITVSHLGGVRVIDTCISEEPHAVARESDDDADLWTSHIGGAPNPDGPMLNMDEAWQRWSETSPDGRPQGGAWHLLDVAHAQGLRLGPHLLSWTDYSESSVLPTTTEGAAYGSTSSTFARVPDGDTGGYDADGPGFTIASAASSADYAENHDYWSGGHGSMVSGSIPVLVAAYGAGSTTTGQVRVQSSPSSWVDCDIAAGTGAWNYAYGHLECGAGPGDEKTAQIFFRRTSGAESAFLQYVSVCRMGQYSPTV